MFETHFWFVLGLIALIGGAELLVRSASRLATQFGISKLIVGLTVVAFGTSAPELAVSIQAGINDQTDIMMGNIVGSNISNILLILGIAAIILPLKVNAKLIRVDVPIMISITVLMFLFALSGAISFWECLFLVFLLVVYLIFLIRENKNEDIEIDIDAKKVHPLLNAFYGIGGLAALIFGARWLVNSAVIYAEMAGVSELIIGLTIVSVGTSLPEIVTSIVAAVKGERDIAVGSVVGSNIFNILVVLGIAGLFIPQSIPVGYELINFDLLILIAASLACMPIFFTGHKIKRWEGALFLSLYICYVAYLYLSSTGHELADLFSTGMLFFVLPLIVITVLSIAGREWKRRQRFKGFGKNKKS